MRECEEPAVSEDKGHNRYVYVSVVIPALNEAQHIQEVLQRLFDQDWKTPYEIVVVDGGSDDGTVELIDAMIPKAPETVTVRVLRNPHRYIPHALNIGIRAAHGDIIVRLDAHTVPPVDFISRCVKALEESGWNAIVGGRCRILPSTDSAVARAIAWAVTHPLGSGRALYRSYVPGDENEERLISVDTVPFGSYTKALWEDVGGYDENLLSAEDYDFALRSRQKGYRVLMDPKLVIDYFSRPTFFALAKQYYRYGYWTCQLIRKHRRIPALRKLMPFGLVTTTIAMTLIRAEYGALLLALYAIVLFSVVVRDSRQQGYPINSVPRCVGALIIVHWMYGVGNWAGLLKRISFGEE